MSDELDLLWMSMQFKFGIVLGIVAWQSALRLAFGWFSGFFEQWLTGLAPSDRGWADNLVNNRAYRVTRALINVLLSIKIPGADALAKRRNGTGNTEIITKDPPASDP